MNVEELKYLMQKEVNTNKKKLKSAIRIDEF